MNVTKCTPEAPEVVETPIVYLVGDLKKTGKSGIYAPAYSPSSLHRLVVISDEYNSPPVMFFVTGSQDLLEPCRMSDSTRYVKTNETLCFEIRGTK